MDAPMSDWFRSIPHSFDGVANAAKVYVILLGSFAFGPRQFVSIVPTRNVGIPRPIL
jgi:hypothetical protein